ncbi:flagellar basal-body MS-ring/collar protein FliF [Desulfobaculum bizertense]|uniref:Flagellar M-ring protein n=1 Tax=Desulfobaculum bizertense DSM 18034 TaxID=1121442 RepID=A0A1T4WS51_9BACT|nr:flagellar basal-body MS-ring/collar protein FliF [Desulfobaculum bizertense]SKA79675.1 flagellar M-ring protein FliF [Desulfobaculum bizertense DSM 18034]
MPPFLNQTFDKLQSYWGKTTMSQRVLIAGLAATVVVTFFMLIFWLNKPDYRVLYSRLYPEDASTVVTMLQKEGVKYELSDNGGTIKVPADKVYDLRLKVAGEGKVHGQGIGFEIFDDVKVGQTDFVQRINYQRALQGELARTISEFPQVERARVHLVLPHKSLFVEEKASPTASVVLKLRQGEKLKPEEMSGIVNLVSMAVEGLDPNHITVADTKGNLVYIPAENDAQASTQQEQRRNIEHALESRIEQMLMPLYGPGRVIAKVNADLDFSRKTIHKQEFDPSSAVVRSEQRSEESQQGDANLQSGSGEPNFRGDGPGDAISKQNATRETRTTNYEINKIEQEIIAPVGELDRLTVAVIVDGDYTQVMDAQGEPTGEFTFVAKNAAELERVRALVSNAVGIDDIRGDSLQVTCMSFGGPEQEIKPNLSQIIMEYVQRLGKPFLNGLLIFLFLVLVVRPVVMALIRPKTEVEGVEGVAGLPEGDARIALLEAEEENEDQDLEAIRKIDDIRAHSLQLSEQNMDCAMAIINTWLKEEATA